MGFSNTNTPGTALRQHVEAKNKVIEWIRAYEGEFEGLEELVAIVETINKDMNITINQETEMSPTAFAVGITYLHLFFLFIKCYSCKSCNSPAYC